MSLRPPRRTPRVAWHNALELRPLPSYYVLHASRALRPGVPQDGTHRSSFHSTAKKSQHPRPAQLPSETTPEPRDNGSNTVTGGDGNSAINTQDGPNSTGQNYVRKYMRELDRFLPLPLRLPAGRNGPESTVMGDLSTLLAKAQADRKRSANLLSHMVLADARYQAALCLADQVLRDFAATWSPADRQPPSQVLWPVERLARALKEPVQLQKPDMQHGILPSTFEAQYESLPNYDAPGLDYIWQFLGILVIESANASSEKAAQTMSVVYQTLARAHHLGLIPDNIYSNLTPSHSSAVQRPPILHLLSSRILTTLSDATWRSYQDEAIARASELGISYHETQDPPGGRFRLKVRDLGPEVWLEFILWCCVETNCSQAGASLVSHLAKQASNPWFAVNWAQSGDIHTGIQIDWDRVKSRTGGTVGRIEGYSSDKPLADVPPRTISVQVVLALVESSLNTASPSGGAFPKLNASVPRTVQKLISFLEPHSLTEEYFDYLTARLLTIASISPFKRPLSLVAMADAVTQIRNLETSDELDVAPVGLNYRSIVQQSELYAGLLHFTMHVLGCTGHVRKAIDMFDRVQALVDSSKMCAIAAFINTPAAKRDGFFDAAPRSGDKEFTMSHGQLPESRISAFLNLLTSNNIVPLAEWLIYSTDADGPLLPEASFRQVAVASALVRFAGTNDDPQLLRHVLLAMRKRRLKPPVTFLRLLVNAQMQCLNFDAASACLRALTPAIGGGYHPDNVACVAACILRLEAKADSENQSIIPNYLEEATSLMEGMLRGHSTNPGDLFLVQKQLFNQQIGHILHICDHVTSQNLNRIAFLYRDKFVGRNTPNLLPRSFNILLQGIVDSMGAIEGMRIWEQFCQRPKAAMSSMSALSFEADSTGGKSSEREPDLLDREDHDKFSTSASSDDKRTSIATSEEEFTAEDKLARLETWDENRIRHESERKTQSTTSLDSDIFWNHELSSTFDDFIILSPSNDDERPSKQQQARERASAEAGSVTASSTPVTVPDVQTLRIIVNKAIDEATASSNDSTIGYRRRNGALRLINSDWAKEQFQAFGLTSEWQQMLEVARGENREGSPMDPKERVGVRRPWSRRGVKVVRISDLFAREKEGGWFSRLPERVAMETGDQQRMRYRERKSMKRDGQRRGWLDE